MAGPVRTTWAQVLRWRLHRHHLAEHDGPDALAVVGRLVGVQAQVPSAARQAVAVRGPAAASVDAALGARTLIRTWAARGTLHLLPGATAASTLALVAAARTWEKPAWQREFASAATVAALATAADEVLADAVLTREELVAALTGRTGPHAVDPAALTSGWSTLLKPLAWQGVLCQGPPRGGRVTFTAPRTWLPGWTGLPDPDTAVRTVLPAWLGAHGPASAAAFDRWLLRGATPRRALRSRVEALTRDGTLTPVEVEGEPLLARAADVDDLLAAPAVDGVRLVPAFDQWVLAPGTTDPRIVPPAHRGEVSRAAGWIAPTVLLDGRVVGTWEPAPADGPGELRIDPFPDAPPLGPEGLDAERARWRDVLTGP